ncbi:hypothetical protein [Nesterenkonia pannonica]|uniref:hypothetical protein n=1 Tax=Nesterenkonia pannonica TaxID=1548602 RepID=UPI002164E010|nr:hypothetical protein [Nesterenkonia pannonica]
MKKLAVNLVAAGLNEATSEGGLASRRGLVSRQESIDDYSLQESFVRGEDEVVDLTEIPDRTRQWLRERFSSQAFVTGGADGVPTAGQGTRTGRVPDDRHLQGYSRYRQSRDEPRHGP